MTLGLVMAKAPVAGQVKTRLAADVGPVVAADLAAAALLDTLDACEDAFDSCHLALSGDLASARSGRELQTRLLGWVVHPQVGHGLGQRLARAHADAAHAGSGPVVQIGMDTPQVTAVDLSTAAEAVTRHDAVLGPAEDGGWWVLALSKPRHARVLGRVPMSTHETYAATLAALKRDRAEVGTAPRMVDVDTVADAELVALVAPHTRFAAAWGAVR